MNPPVIQVQTDLSQTIYDEEKNQDSVYVLQHFCKNYPFVFTYTEIEH